MYDRTTALVIVDTQNDFTHPQGTLYIEGAEVVIAAINDEADRARTAGALVVYTKDWHPPETPHFGKHPGHCVQDTWGAAFHPDLHVDGPTVHKGTGSEDGYSAFSGLAASGEPILHLLLREHGIERLVAVGFAAGGCVKATAIDAATLGYESLFPVALSKGARPVEPGTPTHLDLLREAGVTILEPTPVP